MTNQPDRTVILEAYDSLDYLCWCLESGMKGNNKLLENEKRAILAALPPKPELTSEEELYYSWPNNNP